MRAVPMLLATIQSARVDCFREAHYSADYFDIIFSAFRAANFLGRGSDGANELVATKVAN
jgi:hypothetical protein